MNELEKERQLFLEECNKNKVATTVIMSISFILLIIVFMLLVVNSDYGSLGGIFHPSFHEYQGLKSFLDLDKIYFYLHLLMWAFVIVVLYAIFGRGYDEEAYQKYKKVYKKYVVYDALNCIFDDVKLYDEGFQEKDIEEVGIINTGTDFESEDCFKGKYKKISFEVCDVKTWHYEEDDEGHRDTVVDFEGQYYIFEFNKKFNGNIKVVPNGEIINDNSFEVVKLEDVKFNKLFNVYTDNQHLAYYVLTPALMEKIIALEEKLYGLSFAFINSKIHIACNDVRNLFEFDPYEKINKNKETKEIKNEVSVVTQMIDALDLDDDLFK